jgi:hypothetical protein
MAAVEFAIGIVLLVLVFWDVFQTIVVPRPTPGFFRIARHLTRTSWRLWRRMFGRIQRPLVREKYLGIYAPALVLTLLGTWMVGLLLGYGLIFLALGDELRPEVHDLATALYFAGTSLLTLGFGDVVAAGWAARIVSLMAAATGLGIVALSITYLFSLFGSFQRREILVVSLSARAGAPASSIALLKTYAKLGMVDQLPALFADWERWSAEVLDSHVAYPILGFFRSTHDNVSWVNGLGAVLDAATLVETTVRNVPRAQAELTVRVGAHFVEDLSNLLGLRGDGSGLDQEDFDAAYDLLGRAGYELEAREPAWQSFQAKRAEYAARLEALARYWAVPATRWLQERRAEQAAPVEQVEPATDKVLHPWP